MAIELFQESLRASINESFGNTEAEWRSRMARKTYGPRLDIAVGPFSTVQGVRLVAEYDAIMNNHENFIVDLVRLHLQNLELDHNSQELIHRKMQDLRFTNFNARCFLAVEIENRVSRKHLMGGAVNACALGRIAIAIGYTPDKHRAFLKLHRYFSYLQEVEKPNFQTRNLLIISAPQMAQICGFQMI